MQSITLHITKMHCSSCPIRIDGDLEEVPGVKSAQTNYHSAQSVIEFDENITSIDAIKQVIKDAGYDTEG